MEYWWGEYDDKLKEKGWIENGEYEPYKIIENDGLWQIIRFYGDGALYSRCKHCGFQHATYKDGRNEDGTWNGKTLYAPEKQYAYCPQCGLYMLKSRSIWGRKK